jgi:hypothetical protein
VLKLELLSSSFRASESKQMSKLWSAREDTSIEREANITVVFRVEVDSVRNKSYSTPKLDRLLINSAGSKEGG